MQRQQVRSQVYLLHLGLLLSLLWFVSLTACSPTPGTEPSQETVSKEQGTGKEPSPTELTPDELDPQEKPPVQDRREPLSEPDVVADAGEPVLDSGPDEPVREVAPEPTPRFRFRVRSATEDTVPPKLKAFGLSPASVKVGDIVSVWIEPQTDLSSVISAQAILSGPKGSSTLYFLTTYNPATRRFEGRLKVPASAPGGVWKVSRVSLTDGAGNPSVILGSDQRLKNFSLNVTNPSVDSKGPTLTSIKVKQSSAKAGTFVVVEIKAEDKDSGVSAIRVTAAPQKGLGSVNVDASYRASAGIWEAHLFLPFDASNGTWEVTQVSLDDNANNGTYLNSPTPPLKGVTFTVSGGKPPSGGSNDKTPPVIKGIWLDPLEIQAGDVVRVLVEVQDKDSGVSSGRATFVDPRGAGNGQTDLRYNPALDLWEGSIRFSKYAMDGYWRLGTLQFSDNAGNQTRLDAKAIAALPSLTFARIGQTKEHLRLTIAKPAKAPDRQAPRIKSLQVFPEKIAAGKSIRVYAQLEDLGGSGIGQASCTLQSPLPKITRRVRFDYNSDTGYFEGNVNFKADDVPGQWWISGCYLTDKAGNSASIPGWVLSSLPRLDLTRVTSVVVKEAFRVTVTSTQPTPTDTQAPTLTGVHLAPGVVQAGRALRVFLGASDSGGSGLAGAKCTFAASRGANGGYASEATVDLSLNPATSFWEGNLSINASEIAGRWFLKQCLLVDKAGNSRLWKTDALASIPALSLQGLKVTAAKDHREFEVTARTPSSDRSPPVFEGIAIHPRKVLAGETTRVYVKASDNIGVTQISCSFKPGWKEGPFAYYRSVFLRFNPRSGFWEGQLQIPPLSFDGLWSLSRCDIGDAAGNEKTIRAMEMGQSKALDLTPYLGKTLTKKLSLQVQAGGSAGDTTEPEVVSVRWLPGSPVKAGESALLQVVARDTGSGVSSVSATIKSPKGVVTEYKTLRWNPATQTWEVRFVFPVYGEDGKWSLQDVSVQDNAGNSKTLFTTDAPVNKALIVVSGSRKNPDSKPPIVNSVSLGTRVLQAGQSTRVQASLSDDFSGVGSATIQFFSPTQVAQSQASLAWNPTTQRYEGELLIPKKGEDGVWKAASLKVRDRIGRQTTLSASDKLLSKVNLTVRNSTRKTDTLAPELKRLEIFPGTLKAGGLVSLFAEVTDAGGSGVASVSFQLMEVRSKQRLWITARYNPSTHWFEGRARLSTTAAQGVWKVVRADLSDREGNSRTLTDKDPPLQ